jgi:hypothetical protein
MEFKVRALDGAEEKGVAQVEQELLEKHEKEISNDTPPAGSDTPPAGNDTPPAGSDAPPAGNEEEVELDEQKVLSFIGKRYNKQISSFDELMAERKESEELPEDVSAFLKFKKETGRGIDDFIRISKDFDSMDPETLVREYLSATQEGLDKEDIDALMEDYSYDEELDDESKIKKIKIERKKVINEAKKFFNSQKEKYKTPLESRPASISKEEEEEFKLYREYTAQAKTIEEENARKRQWFDEKTKSVFDDKFKGFEFDLDGKKVSFNPGDAAELRRLQSNPQNFIGKFLDEGGLMKDAVGYHRSLAIAMNPEKFAKFFYEQGIADATDTQMKKIKNVNMSEQRAPEVSKSNNGMQVKAVNPDSGKSLKIRSIKRI